MQTVLVAVAAFVVLAVALAIWRKPAKPYRRPT